jgi:hypothetical protein
VAYQLPRAVVGADAAVLIGAFRRASSFLVQCKVYMDAGNGLAYGFRFFWPQEVGPALRRRSARRQKIGPYRVV